MGLSLGTAFYMNMKKVELLAPAGGYETMVGAFNAGADAVYHALRLDEGNWTGIQPADRLDTIRNVKVAGLELMTGVEPVWDGAAPEVLA